MSQRHKKRWRHVLAKGYPCDECGGTFWYQNEVITGTPPGNTMIYAKLKCDGCGRGIGMETGYRHTWHEGCELRWNGKRFVCLGGKQ